MVDHNKPPRLGTNRPYVVRVHLKNHKGHYKLLGRNALAFKVWYESTEKALQGTKVQFFESTCGSEGVTVVVVPSKAPSGYTREQLEVVGL